MVSRPHGSFLILLNLCEDRLKGLIGCEVEVGACGLAEEERGAEPKP